MSAHRERFATLRARIAADLQPVRPLRLGRRFFPALAGFAALASIALWWIFGLRFDRGDLGPLGLWGLSALEIAAAVALLRLGLREAVPGRSSSGALLALAMSSALGLHLVLSWTTFELSPIAVPPERQITYALYCLAFVLGLGIATVLLGLAVLRRGVVTHPLRASALGGIGAGILGDAVWRLICPYSDPLHMLTSHSGGIVLVVAGALGLGLHWDRSRLRKWRSRCDDEL